MRHDTLIDGKVVFRLDSLTGTATTYNLDGSVASDRPLTAAEAGQFAVLDAANAEQTVREAYQSQADQAIATLEAGWDNWGVLTAGQKDAVLKLTVRVVTRLARLILGRLT